MHLLEDSVDVDGEGLGSSSFGGSLLGSLGGSAGSGSFAGGSLGHFENSWFLFLINLFSSQFAYKATLSAHNSF